MCEEVPEYYFMRSRSGVRRIVHGGTRDRKGKQELGSRLIGFRLIGIRRI